MAEPQLGLRLYDSRSSGARISWVAGKRLAAVDLPDHGSSQHEINGSRQLRDAFGPDRVEGRIRWLRLSDDEGIAAESAGNFTWYDAREAHPTRTEYRFYYDAAALLDEAEPGDLLILMRLESSGGSSGLVGVIVRAGTSFETQLTWLFGLDLDRLEHFTVPDPQVLVERSARIEGAEIVEALGLLRTGERPPATDLDLVRRRFGESFPATAEMSAFARKETVADAVADPDAALLTWLEREEQLFRALEEYIVIQKLDEGFADVDDFISFSLSVQNRRKARMGLALEHQLRAVFDACGVSYTHQAVTENNARPDFLFPGIKAYHDPDFPSDSLHMLAAKSTCKDRWSQVLPEAVRIPIKHLCTLEPGISTARTDEMHTHGVRLVVPESIHSSYSIAQREWLLTVANFLNVAAT